MFLSNASQVLLGAFYVLCILHHNGYYPCLNSEENEALGDSMIIMGAFQLVSNKTNQKPLPDSKINNFLCL